MDLPLGWRTDLGVLAHGGAVIEPAADHLVVRTPGNPTYHWGNFLLVLDPGATDDVTRWTETFAGTFPDAGHLAIGVTGSPDADAWTGVGAVEHDDVLTMTGQPEARALPGGYVVRPLVDPDDWGRSTALSDLCYPGEPDFQAATTAARQQMAAAGDLTWFGAFEKSTGTLAAELGMAHLEDLGRYQSVLTHPEHRRRGLTSHLLGVAAAAARSRGASSLVIVAEADGDAGRLYRAAGFRATETQSRVYRKPGQEPGR